MKLTRRDNPETIKRYGHIKAARGWRTSVCSTGCPGTSHACTLERGHRGPHVAHGFLNRVVAVWDSGPATQVVRSGTGPPSKNKRPIGLRKKESAGMVEGLWRMAVKAAGSAEEIALLVFFVAFVWFAIEWLLLILR